MILRITEDVTRVGVRLMSMGRYLSSWQQLRLTVVPGQWDNPVGPNGSPWFLHGCWYGLPLGVDVANPPACDFPAITMGSIGLGDDCEVEFYLTDRFRQLPVGRYTGIVHYDPVTVETLNPCAPLPKPRPKPKIGKWAIEDLPIKVPPCSHCLPDPVMPPKPPKMRVLATFDIDYGLRDEHIIDHATLTIGERLCDEDSC